MPPSPPDTQLIVFAIDHLSDLDASTPRSSTARDRAQSLLDRLHETEPNRKNLIVQGPLLTPGLRLYVLRDWLIDTVIALHTRHGISEFAVVSADRSARVLTAMEEASKLVNERYSWFRSPVWNIRKVLNPRAAPRPFLAALDAISTPDSSDLASLKLATALRKPHRTHRSLSSINPLNSTFLKSWILILALGSVLIFWFLLTFRSVLSGIDVG